MFTVIKEGNFYAPEPEGRREILVVGGVIALIAEQIDLAGAFGAQVISARRKVVLPGFVDLYVHLLGGGGEGGFWTGTPEITLSTIVRAGVTTLVGCLGTPKPFLPKPTSSRSRESQHTSTQVPTSSRSRPSRGA